MSMIKLSKEILVNQHCNSPWLEIGVQNGLSTNFDKNIFF